MTAPGGTDAGAAARRGGAPEAVGSILPRVLRESGFGTIRRSGGLVDLWARAAGAALAQETRPSTLRRGVLTVEVRSAGLLAELAGFRTQELLSRILAENTSGRVTGLRFRPGVF